VTESAVLALLCAALVGVVHVHHAPSHDTDAPFEDVLAAAREAGLDFVVLTEHADERATSSTLPAAERAGLHAEDGRRPVLVLVGVELGTDDGHLLALDVREMPRPADPSGRAAIASVHALGGFAVVPHPFTYGGWGAWDADFDGLEVHNNAESFRLLGFGLPFAVLRSLADRDAALRSMLVRPARALARWEELLAKRRVIAFSGADAHQNVSLLGLQLDPYAPLFGAVQTVCPDAELEPRALWNALRGGRCFIRYAIHARPDAKRTEVRFPSGRREIWVDSGRNVLEVHQAPERATAILGAP
jgi:hypothetical protein